MGRGGAAYDSSNSLRSQDRASDGGMGGAASTSGFSGFEDATEGRNAHPCICSMHTCVWYRLVTGTCCYQCWWLVRSLLPLSGRN